ncbi:DUF6602 domain-containing protein [Pseudophaeobacter sp. EL27]|uniref:DUF6602 domain-containing protein n=1 Tax=Pseudophaeobacter sp. EL27 TaxID=2107580 RepID=UPI0013C4246E|nr:DUF6602 domain-containing protein [Pseudophaeobacter sp. EL27]
MPDFLNNHFKALRQNLLSKSGLAHSGRNSTLIGSVRELVITEFFEGNLPKGFDYNTGEIVDPKDVRSGQIDILIVPNNAPRLSLGERYAISLAHGVAATFEVKSDLNTKHLKEALQSTNKVKRLSISKGDLYPWPWSAETNSGKELWIQDIPNSIISFKSCTEKHLLKKLKEHADNGGELPDTITCLELDFTLVRNNGWLAQKDGDDLYISSHDGIFKGAAPLLIVFDYYMKVLQAWDYAKPRTPLLKYQPV